LIIRIVGDSLRAVGGDHVHPIDDLGVTSMGSDEALDDIVTFAGDTCCNSPAAPKACFRDHRRRLRRRVGEYVGDHPTKLFSPQSVVVVECIKRPEAKEPNELREAWFK